MAFHQYSPLFTSGLLSDASVSRTPSPARTSTVHARSSSHRDTQSHSRRQKDELRSFLSLADSQSPTSPNMDNYPSSSTKSSRRMTSVHSVSTIYQAPQVSNLHRSLLEDRQHLPPQKYAPVPNDSNSRGGRRGSRPSVIIPSNPHQYPESSHTSPSLPDSPSVTKAPSVRSASVKSVVKRSNRSAALARLEGRSDQTDKSPRRHQNFMNMNDDDEDDEDDYRDPNIVIEDFPSPQSSASSTWSRPSTNPNRFHRYSSITPTPSRPTTEYSHDHSHKRTRPVESWLPPVTNFIDLKDEDRSSWRSFIKSRGQADRRL